MLKQNLETFLHITELYHPAVYFSIGNGKILAGCYGKKGMKNKTWAIIFRQLSEMRIARAHVDAERADWSSEFPGKC